MMDLIKKNDDNFNFFFFVLIMIFINKISNLDINGAGNTVAGYPAWQMATSE